MTVARSSETLSKRSLVLTDRIAGASYKDLAAKHGIGEGQIRAYCRRAIKAGTATHLQLRMRLIERGKLPDEEYDRRWLERLKARTIVNEQGCFLWQGPVGKKGYILHGHRQWQNSGHRIVYRILRKKDLATSDLVCHECDTRRCWNIDHLFIGTEAVNNRDCGNKGRHHNSVKTHCKFGHEFTPENTGYKKGPGTMMRVCKECARLRCLERYRRNPEAARRKRREWRATVKARRMGAGL